MDVAEGEALAVGEIVIDADKFFAPGGGIAGIRDVRGKRSAGGLATGVIAVYTGQIVGLGNQAEHGGGGGGERCRQGVIQKRGTAGKFGWEGQSGKAPGSKVAPV